MSEELFNQLLSDLEASTKKLPDSLFDAIKTDESSHLAGIHAFGLTSTDVLKVMKSGIFYEGTLKWRQIRGKKGVYKTFPINDLPFFIIEITNCLAMPWFVRYSEKEPSIWLIDTIIKLIDELTSKVQGSKRSINELEGIRQTLHKMKANFLSKDNPEMPYELIKSYNIYRLIEIFKEQVPGSKPFVVATAIQKLLNQFGIAVEHPAIFQRIKRSA